MNSLLRETEKALIIFHITENLRAFVLNQIEFPEEDKVLLEILRSGGGKSQRFFEMGHVDDFLGGPFSSAVSCIEIGGGGYLSDATQHPHISLIEGFSGIFQIGHQLGKFIRSQRAVFLPDVFINDFGFLSNFTLEPAELPVPIALFHSRHDVQMGQDF